jgi:hypothetical protein
MIQTRRSTALQQQQAVSARNKIVTPTLSEVEGPRSSAVKFLSNKSPIKFKISRQKDREQEIEEA